MALRLEQIPQTLSLYMDNTMEAEDGRLALALALAPGPRLCLSFSLAPLRVPFWERSMKSAGRVPGSSTIRSS